MRVAAIYAAGAAMGWTTEEVKASSLWEFISAWRGWVKANSPKSDDRLTEAEKDMLWADIDAIGAPGDPLSTMTYRWDGWRLVEAGRVWIVSEINQS